MGDKSKSFQRSGVRVTVVNNEKTFDLIIHIDAGTNLEQKRKHPQFRIKFKAMNAQTCMVAQKPVHLEFSNLPYKTSQYNIRKNFKKDFAISKDIFCRISLTPQFYLSEPLFKLAKSSQKRGKKGKFAGECGSVSKTSNSVKYGSKDPIPYSYTNLFKPFQGGKVSPR